MSEQVQQLNQQLVHLKARVYDLTESLAMRDDFIKGVVERVGFKGNTLEELLLAIPMAQPQQE